MIERLTEEELKALEPFLKKIKEGFAISLNTRIDKLPPFEINEKNVLYRYPVKTIASGSCWHAVSEIIRFIIYSYDIVKLTPIYFKNINLK